MSFLSLPRELRDAVYRELLCPADGIGLKHAGHEKLQIIPPRQCGFGGADSPRRYGRDASFRITKRHPITNGLLRVNRQVSAEAEEILYGENRFFLDVYPRQCLTWLKGRSERSRRVLRSLAFKSLAISAYNDDELRPHWIALKAYIRRVLCVKSVAVKFPLDNAYHGGERKLSKLNPELNFQLLFPSVCQLHDMLMDGVIQELRLGYYDPRTVRLKDGVRNGGNEGKGKQWGKVDRIDSTDDEYLESFKIIRELRYRRPEEEREREYMLMATSECSLRPGHFEEWKQLREVQVKRRKGLRFKVKTAKDDPRRHFGTVLVLTRKPRRKKRTFQDGDDQIEGDVSAAMRARKRQATVRPEDHGGLDELDTEGSESDEDGYDEFGYDEGGFDRDGFDIEGYDGEGYDVEGYDVQGYDVEGYNKGWYGSQRYYSGRYDRGGYNSGRYERGGYDRRGYDRGGYNRRRYDRRGIDKEGYDRGGI